MANIEGNDPSLSNDGSILLSLPHVGHSAIAASMLQDDFEYREWGLLDKTHIRFFGVKNVQALIENANLAIVESHFIRKKPEETEFEESWKKLSRRAQSILNDRLFGDVYQIVTKSVLSETLQTQYICLIHR